MSVGDRCGIIHDPTRIEPFTECGEGLAALSPQAWRARIPTHTPVSPLRARAKLPPITPIGKPPPLAVRLAEALPFRRAQGSEEKRPIHIRPPAYGRGVPET